MGTLVLGLGGKHELLNTKKRFLLIDSGELCDLAIRRFPRAKVFDYTKHSFNPLHGMVHTHEGVTKAREFADIVFPDKDLMTYRNGKRALVKMALAASRLDRIQAGKSDAEQEAQDVIDDLLLSPLMRRILCGGGETFSFRGKTQPPSVIARINPGDTTLALLLMAQYQGDIIVSDFGLLARPFHMRLLKENRLSVGLATLNELEPALRQAVLLMDTRVGRKCTLSDAKVLAEYAGCVEATNEYNDYIKFAMT